MFQCRFVEYGGCRATGAATAPFSVIVVVVRRKACRVRAGIKGIMYDK